MKNIPKLHKEWLNKTLLIFGLDKICKLLNIVSIFLVYVELEKADEWFENVNKNR